MSNITIRRLDLLALLAEGKTQAEVARRVGMSARQVARVAALHRLRAAVPLEVLPEAIHVAFERENNARRRATLLHDLARLTMDEAKALRRELRGRSRAGLPSVADSLRRPSAPMSDKHGLAPEGSAGAREPDDVRRAAADGLALVAEVERRKASRRR